MIINRQAIGRHKDWRRIAKKERRRRIRIEHAKQRDNVLNSILNEDQNWLQDEQMLQLFEREQIEKLNQEENEKWIQAEAIAIKQWQRLQEQKELMHQKHLQEKAKLKLEWELEQKRKKEKEEKLREIEEENKRKQQIFMERLEEFLSGSATEPPSELLISRETKPNTELCPFFLKTACCRFADQCSRNHQYPGISKVLLATNFYVHFGLDNANYNEYDTDVMLEYEDSDTYKDFKEFFFDVLPEFEKYGRIVQIKDQKVCNNYEKHLRGNVYVEYAAVRAAVAAYRALHSRWYAGRQLSLQFCNISSWKRAICGLQSRRRCPKGRVCNFLHVFRNPNNLFSSYDLIDRDTERNRRTPPRSWRWSESPEPEESTRSEYTDRRRDKSRDDRRAAEHYRKHRRRHARTPKRKSSRSERSKDRRKS